MTNIDSYGRILHNGDIICYISHPSNDPEMKMGMILSISPSKEWRDGLIVVQPLSRSFKKPSKTRKVLLRQGFRCNRTFEKDLDRYFDYGDLEVREDVKEFEEKTGQKWHRSEEFEQVRYWPRIIKAISHEAVLDPSVYTD